MKEGSQEAQSPSKEVGDELESVFQEHPTFSILPDIYEKGSVISV